MKTSKVSTTVEGSHPNLMVGFNVAVLRCLPSLDVITMAVKASEPKLLLAARSEFLLGGVVVVKYCYPSLSFLSMLIRNARS